MLRLESPRVVVEIIGVGEELLIGKIANTNAQWLAKRITSLGGRVRRATTIGDNIADVASAVREAYNRNPAFILTTGGLGPTFDDKTLAGIAEAFSLPLEVNPTALKMVERRYQELSRLGVAKDIEMTKERVKMATLPKGAEPIHNPIGTAPAVLLRRGETGIIALPGVPPEMRAIFDKSVAEIIKAKAPDLFYEENSMTVKGIMESAIAPAIDVTMRCHPTVYIKSHPKGEEGRSVIDLHFSTTAPSREKARAEIGKAIETVKELVEKLGAGVGQPK